MMSGSTVARQLEREMPSNLGERIVRQDDVVLAARKRCDERLLAVDALDLDLETAGLDELPHELGIGARVLEVKNV